MEIEKKKEEKKNINFFCLKIFTNIFMMKMRVSCDDE